MITLYGFGDAYGLPDASPFVTKTEMLLRLAGLAYRKDTGGFRRAPKGKLPYIDDAGEVVADSTFIRWHIEKKYGHDFDAGFTGEERAMAWALEKMLEDNLYWALVHSLWLDQANFVRGPANLFKPIPWPARPAVETLAKSAVRKQLHAQGLGRHSPAERHALGVKAVESVAAILRDKSFLLGERPCGTDAACFAFIGGLLSARFEIPLGKAVLEKKNLVRYAERLEGIFEAAAFCKQDAA